MYRENHMAKYTPAMQQYIDLKKQHADCILFFRLGDFYEVFFEDAKLCSKELDIVLTAKNKTSDNPIPMAGIPYHSAEKYINKLIQNGHKVAIAEQTTAPVPGKIVEREVVSVVTPGTYIQETNKDFSYIVAVTYDTYKDWNNYHIAWWDFSIGEYTTKSFGDLEKMEKFILSLNPAEIIFDIDFPNKDEFQNIIKNYINSLISVYDVPVDADKYVLNQCNIQTLASYGKALEEGRLNAFALLLHYIKNTQKTDLSNIVRVSLHNTDNRVILDDITIKNLEIFASSYESSAKYSLVWILDNTKTAWWGRLLRYILANPIKDIKELNNRLSHIEYYIDKINEANNIHNLLGHISDIPRLSSSILYRKLLPSLFVKFRATLRSFYGENNDLLSELHRLWFKDQSSDKVKWLYEHLNTLLKADDLVKDDINFINNWYDTTIDELRKTAYNSDELLMEYQQELVNKSWIANVKLKFVTNQWYFIEVTNKDIEWLEKIITSWDYKFDLMRRQTLKWAQRYVTPYLDEIQKMVMEAKDKLVYHEFSLLEKTKEQISNLAPELNEFANYISWLDLYTSQGILAKEKKFIKPELKTDWELNIKAGNHPVIEEFLPNDQQFIPNNLHMSGKQEDIWFLHVITWPNMWGKSTFLRQNALIVLMAHCGLYIPASEAKIGIVDGIFARVGSGDVIAKNQSTFMTEMIEVANILNNATANSFVIFDELWRGTSTYDGLALTKSILEFIAMQTKSKTLIATHYHELIKLEWQLPWVKNFSVSVYETDKEVVFMKKIVKWWASKSYGLDVAKLAGISQNIIDRAEQNLMSLEMESKSISGWSSNLLNMTPTITKTDPKFKKIKQLLKSFDVNNMTPMQALQLLAKIKDDLK